MSDLPVVVIGAGPLGLAAAAHLLGTGPGPAGAGGRGRPGGRGQRVGPCPAFSPWTELVDAAAARLLEPTGWTAPEAGYPTGAEWIASYLRPLAESSAGMSATARG